MKNGKAEIRRLDREIRKANRRLEAVRNRELWPLDRRERRAVLGGIAAGSVPATRNRSTKRADDRIDSAWMSAEARLLAEEAALRVERQRLITAAARARAARWGRSR